MTTPEPNSIHQHVQETHVAARASRNPLAGSHPLANSIHRDITGGDDAQAAASSSDNAAPGTSVSAVTDPETQTSAISPTPDAAPASAPCC